jgi:hypothetical protein
MLTLWPFRWGGQAQLLAAQYAILVPECAPQLREQDGFLHDVGVEVDDLAC